MRNRRRNWFLRRLVLGFAIALVVVPVAQARPEGALPPLAHSGVNSQGTFVQGVDDFPGSSYIAPELNGGPERFVNGVPGSGYVAPEVNGGPAQVGSSPSSQFDWADAGIGAGTVFAVMLLGAGAVLATRHVGRPAQI